MPLSIQRTDNIRGFVQFFILEHLLNNGHCIYIFQSVWLNAGVNNVQDNMVSKILTNVCQ